MKKIILVFFISFFIYSCSKSESTPTATPQVIIKLSGCDSIKQRLLKPNTQDTLRLLSCIIISANDSMRLGLIKIGTNYQGGIVVYFLRPGERGYNTNIKHGLIVANSDQSHSSSFPLGVPWYNNGSNIITRATDTAVGSGSDNTDKIIFSQGGIPTNYAAGLAREYKGGGYSDWFLPSIGELKRAWENQNNVGGFKKETYLSSSEFELRTVWGANMWYKYNITNPYELLYYTFVYMQVGKQDYMHVRAFRYF
jgi:hypothetical protein